MPDYLNIPNDVYRAAANAVWELRRQAEPSISIDSIEQEIRAYVWAGQRERCKDYSYLLSDAERNIIIGVVQSATNELYHWTPARTGLTVTMNTLETQTAYGKVSAQIMQPNAKQKEYQAAIDSGRDQSTLNPFTDGIGLFFSWIKDGISAIFKSIGIDLSSPLVIGIIGIAIFFFINMFRGTNA